jgi:hypothetical protein
VCFFSDGKVGYYKLSLMLRTTKIVHEKHERHEKSKQKKCDKSLYLEKVTLKFNRVFVLFVFFVDKIISCITLKNNKKIFKTTGHLYKFYKKVVQQVMDVLEKPKSA